MFRWAEPQVLIWILAALALMGGAWASLSQAKARLSKAFGDRLAPYLTRSVSQTKRTAKIILQALVLSIMILALARPQAGQSKEEIKSEGIEVVFAVDVSESMLADDVRPSRLEQAKVDLGKLVDLMTGNKIALVAFAGSAALLSPLTNDPSSLKLFIDSLTTNSVSTQGTNFAQALEEARGAFKRGSENSDNTAKVNRAVIILSDGEDHEPGAHKVAETMASEGTRIFTLAYGTQKGGPIPERDALGYLKGYKKDHGGNTILTTVNGDELKKLADSGRGQFNFASPGTNYLNRIWEAINAIEKTQFESQMAMQYQELFQRVLLCALILGMIELSLGERRTPFRLWRGRFEVPPQ